MTEYRTYFKVALYPKGIKGCYIDEDCEFIVDYDIQHKYLCNSEQSTQVLKYITNVYKTSVYGEYGISDLKYLGKGEFSCLIKFNYEDFIEHDELEELITSLIWPGDYHEDVFIMINNEKLELDIELETYIEETDVDEEEIYESEEYADDESEDEETEIDESEEYADDESEEIDDTKDSDDESEETEIDDAKDSEYFPSESGEDDETYSDSETEESSNDTDVENDYIDDEADKIFCKNYENDDEYIPSHYNKQIETDYDNISDTESESDNEISSNDYMTNDYLTNCKPNLYLLFAFAIYAYVYFVFKYYINDL